jgi:hypothetical protein
MKRLLLGSLIAMVAATTAHAGALTWSPVKFEANNYASGSIADARADTSGTGLSYITLSVSSYSSSRIASVTMRNSAGVTQGCSTTNANMVTAIASATNDAWVRIQWDASGSCTSIQIVNDGRGAPKTP